MISFDEWIERFASEMEEMGYRLEPWQRVILEIAYGKPEDPPERTLPDDPPDLDTWEGEGGALPVERRSARNGWRADLVILDEIVNWPQETPATPDPLITVCAGCQSCFAETIDLDAVADPPACTRYPGCDHPHSTNPCIWPDCSENQGLTRDP